MSKTRPARGALIGIEFVAKAAPDGYTLLLGHGGAMTVQPALYPKLPFHVLRDFAPIGMLTESALILVTAPTSGIGSVDELVRAGKAADSKVTYSSGGVGSSAHTTAELFNFRTGIKALHIPYKGAAPATVAVVAGDVTYTFTGQAPGWPLIDGGKLKALAVTSAERLPDHPNIPTIAESGVSDFTSYDWNFLLAPAGTPVEIVDRLNKELLAILAEPDTQAQLRKAGMEVRPGTPQALTKRITAELATWAQLVKDAGIKVE